MILLKVLVTFFVVVLEKQIKTIFKMYSPKCKIDFVLLLSNYTLKKTYYYLMKFKIGLLLDLQLNYHVPPVSPFINGPQIYAHTKKKHFLFTPRWSL